MRFTYKAVGFLDAELHLGIDNYQGSLPTAAAWRTTPAEEESVLITWAAI